jgi:hypothetical protein
LIKINFGASAAKSNSKKIYRIWPYLAQTSNDHQYLATPPADWRHRQPKSSAEQSETPVKRTPKVPYADPAARAAFQREYQAEYRRKQDPERRRFYQKCYYLAHHDAMLAKGARYRAWRKALAHAAFTSAA